MQGLNNRIHNQMASSGLCNTKVQSYRRYHTYDDPILPPLENYAENVSSNYFQESKKSKDQKEDRRKKA